MADGDNAEASIGKRLDLLERDIGSKGQLSYFFDHHVKSCISEQHKLLGYKLFEKEKEANITYDKSFSGLFDGEAQVNHDFVQALFDSDAHTSLDRLTEDLATLANGEGCKEKTRLLDLLYVTRREHTIMEEQKIRNAQYDLYDAEAKGKLDSMATYAALLSKTSIVPGDDTPALAMLLSMLATGQEPIVDAALVLMAKTHGLHWDALLLARFYFGANHAITRRVHDAWKEAVLKDKENKFPMIKIAISLNTINLKNVAQTLMAEVSNKTKGKELIHAYRCLAISLEVTPSPQSDLQKKLEIAEVSSMMLSIWVTMLGWGNIYWAKSTIADIAKRAPSGDIPSDIYQIGLTCLVELVETLLIPLNLDSSTTLNAPFTTIASKWRKDIAGEGEMHKLKTDNLRSQKVLYMWIQQIGAALRVPLLEEPDLSMKMDCVFLATEFLHEMLRWAATAQEGESLRLYAPDKPIKMKIEDDAIVVREEGQRGRNSSVVSTRSTLTAKENGKKQTRKGDAKEEPASVPIVQDTRSHNGSRMEGNQQNRERTNSFSAAAPDWPRAVNQRNEQQSSNRGMNQRGGAGDAGQANQQNNVAQFPRGSSTQDYRKNQQSTGGAGEFNGARLVNGAAVLSRLLPNGSLSAVPLAQSQAPPHSGHFTVQPHRMNVTHSPRLDETPRNGSVPTSASSSGVDLNTKREESDCSSPSSAALPVISQESLAALTEPATPKLLGEIFAQHQQTQSNETVPVPDPITEQTQASVDESTRDASTSQLPASGQSPTSPSIPQHPTVDTVAVDKAHERSLESVQQTVESHPSVDSVYDDLMKKEQMEDGDERPIAPEPGEMNRLFTGNSKGQSTLPLNLLTDVEQETAAGATAPTMIMQSAPPPPLPSLVTAESSPLTPPPMVLPTEENRRYESSTADSILTPIPETSQESSVSGSTVEVSESDRSGLANDSTDTDNTNPLEVDVDAQTVNQWTEAPIQLTPHLEDLIINNSQADSPAPSPLAMTSSLPHTTSATESSDLTTVVETTETAEVRKETEDENQLHQPILTPGPTDEQKESEETPVVQMELNGHETAQMQTAVPPEIPVAPTNEQQQSLEQQEVQSVTTGFPSLFSDPLPSLPSLPSLPPPSASVATPNEPVMTVSVMPHFEEPAMAQSSRSETSEQQMGQSTNEQVTPTPMEQQMEDTMVGTQPQRPIDHDATEESSVSTTSQDDKHLSVDCTDSEVQERVTSCGVQYKFSLVKDEVVDPAVASMGEQEQIQEPVQNSLLDGLLSMMDMTYDVTDSQSDGTITKDEIDEHAAQRRQEASERGDMASDIGSTSNPHPFPPTMSEVPSVPSSTTTTPEPSIEYQQHYNLVPSNNGGDGGEEAATSIQMSANSLSMHSHGDQSEQQQQQSTVQPAMEPSNGGDGMNNQEPATEIPIYVDPFEHKPPPALYQGNVLKDAPCFGTLGNLGQNTQPPQQNQSHGHGGQMTFTNSNRGLGQDQGIQNPNWGGNQNRPYGQHRGGRGEGGGGRGRGNRGGRGGGESRFNGGNNPQQQQQQGNSFGGGDNGQQKSFPSRGNYGGQDARAHTQNTLFPRGGRGSS